MVIKQIGEQHFSFADYLELPTNEQGVEVV